MWWQFYHPTRRWMKQHWASSPCGQDLDRFDLSTFNSTAAPHLWMRRNISSNFAFAPLDSLCFCPVAFVAFSFYHTSPHVQLIDKCIHVLLLLATASLKLFVNSMSLNKATCLTWFMGHKWAGFCHHHRSKTSFLIFLLLPLFPSLLTKAGRSMTRASSW